MGGMTDTSIAGWPASSVSFDEWDSLDKAILDDIADAAKYHTGVLRREALASLQFAEDLAALAQAELEALPGYGSF